MRSRLSYWCDGLIEAAILVAVIAAPLFFNIHSDRVFEPDKLTLVRSLAILMSVGWLVGFIDRQGWKNLGWLRWKEEDSIWRLPFALPVLLLVVVYLISTLFSVVPRVSWAGSYQRLQGTYTTLSYIVIFALAAVTFRRREQINRLVTAVILTSIPVSLYALLQHYGLDPLPWGGNVQRRVAGHMGNAIFIAAYLIMAVPPTTVRIIDAFTNILGDEELSYADVVRSSVYIFVLAVQLVAIYWSGSRGPMLGLIVGMFALVLILLVSLRNAVTERGRFKMADLLRALALVGGGLIGASLVLYLLFGALGSGGGSSILSGSGASFAAFGGAVGIVAIAIFAMVAARRGWRWLWLSWLLLAAVVAGWLGLFNLSPEATGRFEEAPVAGNVVSLIEEWRELPTVGRFGRLLEAESGTGRVRVLIWEGALELIKPHEPLVYPDGTEDPFNFLRPVIGYGPESMYVAYNRFYVPELATLEARNASPDRSHNETFDALIITGAAGFVVWQALYLSVFYYGFLWLGVVRSRRDRNLLIGFWIGGAIVGALLITQWLGIVFIGVAIPFGSIAGLVLYLMYYALFASTGQVAEEAPEDPFRVDRLLMMGLLAAVVAHYVEIHFGIAIAATRVHFFVYIALMFLIGYLLPRLREEADEVQASPRVPRQRRRRLSSQPGWLSSALASAFVLAIIVAILGYNFMNYVRPQGAAVQSIADVPSAGDILHQAFFVNPGRGFSDSPFIFLTIILTWFLGSLASISELVRQGILETPAANKRGKLRTFRNAALLFIGLVVAAFAVRFLGSARAMPDTTQLLGQGMLLIWSALCLWAALRLLQEHKQARATGGTIAGAGLVFSVPVLVAGASLYGTLMLLGCVAILYLLWDRNWNQGMVPAFLISLGSLVIGLAYAYVHAFQIRSAVFFGPPQPMGDLERLIFSADRFASFLTVFYAFIVVITLGAAVALAQPSMSRTRQSSGIVASISMIILLAAGIFAINVTNVRIIQADMVYKQARPLDEQASRSGEPQAWDAPIAIYEHAIELAPVEDFYYLFLGRAYLEKAAVVADPDVQEQLLQTARERLLVAQEINPLNTDHTANLARLTTRWATVSNLDPARRQQLLDRAKSYYQDALQLSPQNSVIRNEYANLQLTLESDCGAAIATFNNSLDIDPYYANTYFSLAAAYETCASQQPAGQQQTYYRNAAEMMEAGLARRDANAGTVLLQAGQLYRQAGDYEEAIARFEEARQLEDSQVPSWTVDYRLAEVYDAMGDGEMAREIASRALASAPPDAQAQIQTFLDQLSGQ